MNPNHKTHLGIPISVSLEEDLLQENIPQNGTDKQRIAFISFLAVMVALLVSGVAKILVQLINLITNISFHQQFSLSPSSPATNHYGLWVILIPAVGGLIVGLMALYGSKAIRGHGIPEAMEQILTNQSKIPPSITYLNAVISALLIGT